ncbi:WDR59 protein [Capsaspora owczarzaki ATCC 30864]|uniref:WDR59 protein n=1 Tax=Capsaspora owczarzaki (strain ATCC 30864) TaxID=595528 RepID=A0A0D2UQH2_CAPO3|nr:WDR59 protein [Capsaspora owczarzaki ATCC 30864]KJE97251.1 WDR59 protein [Capsaspora owczarzaki ATCC 30864]|eukprot:XP_004343564.1 WDR59 protein [Capsaspora owczarzaki ATCC 30864]
MAGPSSTSGTTGTTTTTSGSNTMRGSPSPVTSPGPLLMSGQTTPQPSLMHPYGHHHHHQQQQQQQQHSAVTTPIAASSSSAAAATAGVLSRGASSNSLTSLGLNPAAANMLDVSSSFSISGAPGAAGLGGTGSGSGSAATTLYPSASFHASSTSLSMLAADAESTTFGTNMVARLDQQPTCFSIDASGTLGVVASRKGLSIIDLEAPDQPARPLVHHTKWEINDVQWNPHTTRSSYIASTSNTKALIWNAADDRTPLLHVLKTHQRAISDINWSNFDENVLATASVDTYIHVWDIRDPSKPSASLCAWTSGALQVKWNRFNRNLLASAHDGDVRIWDLRKGTAPAVYITGHMAKIYGLDWSRSSENELVSCAQDAKAKLWNITNTRAPQAVIHAGAPIWRARFTPFGNGLLTITLPPPQLRVDNSVLLWSLDNVSAPIHSYNGHSEQVKEFDWRIRGSDDYRDFQLVTCSKTRPCAFGISMHTIKR